MKDLRSLGLFSLIMIAVVSVDSLRNLPISAQYGYSLITFYLLAGCLFFLPLAYISSKLAVKYPLNGGSYNWIKAAFGNSFATMGIWLQWIYNMIWYPTIFAFTTEILLSIMAPHLANNKWLIFLPCLSFFWFICFFHARGVKVLSFISTPGAIIGVLIPMGILILMGLYWLISGQPPATPWSWQALIPGARELQNLGFFSNILFSLLGLEVIAMHAGYVKNPEETYPKAFSISALIILFSIIFSSIALCIIVPVEKIELLGGIVAVLNTFFAAYNVKNITVLIGLFVIIGSLGIASSWMMGMARGLHAALKGLQVPAWFTAVNKNEIPSNVLIVQGIVYSIVLSLFLLIPDINRAYWVLSAITAQFALLYYMLLFVAAIKLLGTKLAIGLSVLAIMVCFIGIVVGFLPPESLQVGDSFTYILGMMISFLVIAFTPVFLIKAFGR